MWPFAESLLIFLVVLSINDGFSNWIFTWDDFPPITCRDIFYMVMMLESWMLEFNSSNSLSHLKITFNCELVWRRCVSGMDYQTTQVIIFQAVPSGLVVVAQIIQHFVKINN